MEPTWLSVIPPLIVLAAACLTKRIHLSIIIGVACAALIATTGAPLDSMKLIWQRFFQYVSDKDSIYMYSFLIIIGCIIMLIVTSGGISASAYHMRKRFSNKRTAESSTFMLSVLVGIDDYLNSITVGHVMQPIADRFGIARAKLAYLLHAMAGPLVILVPISSWAAVITTNLDSAGISLLVTKTTKIAADPFFVYLKTLPFIFYSVFTIFSVWYIIRRQLSFGPMSKYEAQAHEHVMAKTEDEMKPSSDDHSLLDIIVPLATLFTCVIIGILYTGGYHLFGGSNSLIDALKNSKNSLVLFMAGAITWPLTLILGFMRKKIPLSCVPKSIKDGFLLMAPAILIIIFANTLGNIMKYDLFTGDYLAHTFLGSLSIVVMPIMFFFISAIVALLTGTSWGTITLILPIAIPMLTSMLALPEPVQLSSIPILFPTLGGIFSGATCGDHLSPLSETTVMCATSAGTDPFTHFITQFPYAIAPIIASSIAFLASGLFTGQPLWLNLLFSLISGLAICIVMLQILQKSWKKNSLQK